MERLEIFAVKWLRLLREAAQDFIGDLPDDFAEGKVVGDKVEIDVIHVIRLRSTLRDMRAEFIDECEKAFDDLGREE